MNGKGYDFPEPTGILWPIKYRYFLFGRQVVEGTIFCRVTSHKVGKRKDCKCFDFINFARFEKLRTWCLKANVI